MKYHDALDDDGCSVGQYEPIRLRKPNERGEYNDGEDGGDPHGHARNDQYEQQRFSERIACKEVWHDGAFDGIDTPHGGQDHQGYPDA